jgi:hypothetical protein
MGGFNRDHKNGQKIIHKFISAWSKGEYSEAYHSGADRFLLNNIGDGAILQGPYQGNIPRSTAGGLVVGNETNPENNLGQRTSGYGRRWERLHLIGVSAGHLGKRDYSNYNTMMGSHGLNTAMIPFEGIVNWVISQKRKYIYSVNVESKILELEKMSNSKHVEWTKGNVAESVTQTISYTSSNDDNIWINLQQESTCPIVSNFKDYQQIAHEKKIPDDWKLSSDNEAKVYAEINRINAIIINIQDKHSQLNNAWKNQHTIGRAMV